MAIAKSELEQILKTAFPESEIIIEDIAGDEDHYSLVIKDSSFKGLSVIAQHKLVKEALKEVLVTRLHAITIKTIVK